MRIRPVRMEDHAAVLELAHQAGIGMTSLPQDSEVLRRKIEHAVRSFSRQEPGKESFLFVLEDTKTGALAGTTGIVTHVGLSRPFYSYKLSTLVQASSAAGIYSLQRVLHMVNDYTGVSEIGSLFLSPAYRKGRLGRFLSRARYLFLAEMPDLFSDTVISEIRGVQDGNAESPFYNNLARNFFQMEFKKADYVSATQGSQFIADLMPKYPIYVNLLPLEAQACIGTPHEASKPAMEMLIGEGFRHQGYIDVFDAGPTLQAERAQIRTVRESRSCVVGDIKDGLEGPPFMIASTSLESFTVCQGAVYANPDGTAAISRESANKIGVKVGDSVRFAAMEHMAS